MSLLRLAWRHAARALAPALPWYLRRRVARGKELPERLAERFGFGAERPEGPLLWLHAASVGEVLSILPLLEALGRQAPRLTILMTTGTVTSAALLARRLPAGARVLHRFVPLDVPAAAARFLDGWRPDAAGFVESELWPNLLAAARARGIPLALVNGRMSARSSRRWRLAAGLGRSLMADFALVMAQSAADAARFRALGAAHVADLGNLKDAAPPLPADPAALAALRAAIGGRAVFLAASTHPGEEALAIAAHQALAAAHPGLLTILAPRHPERGPAVAALAEGLTVARRAAGALPGPETALYVADTIGEMGLLFRVADVAFIGGSLVPHGGQNPREAARLGCAMVFGPHMGNFTEPVARLLAAGGAVQLPGVAASALAAAVGGMLSDAVRRAALAEAAAASFAAAASLPEDVAGALLRLLPVPAAPGDARMGLDPLGQGSGEA